MQPLPSYFLNEFEKISMPSPLNSKKTISTQTWEIPLGEDTGHVITAHRFLGNSTGPSVYIQAGIHGNEHPGILVAVKLIEKIKEILSTHTLKGSITIVPLCNPIALSQTVQGEIIGRFNMHTGKNFNRNFPDLSHKVVDKCNQTLEGDIGINAIRAVLKDMLDKHTCNDISDQMKSNVFQLASEHEIVIDLHADNRSLLHIYMPEHGTDITEILAAELDCNLAIRGFRDPEGGLDDALNYFWSVIRDKLTGCQLKMLPVAYTIELRGRYDISEILAMQDANALYNFLCRTGVIDDEVSAKQNTLAVFPVNGIDSPKASKPGVLKLHGKLGDYIAEGDLIAEIMELSEAADGTTTELRSLTDGILFCHSFHGIVPPGQTVYKIAGTKQLHNEADYALEK